MNTNIRLFNCIVFFLLINVGISQNFIIDLWPKEIPNSKDSELIEVEKNNNGRIISKVIIPSIEVYLPSKFNAIGKAIMICPGGGYGNLAYEKEGTDIAKWLNGYGIAAAVLKYRLPEKKSNKKPHLSPLIDAKRGMEIIRYFANEWGIDPDKVGVLGFSAGGHLATTLGTSFDSNNRPNFMALIYPVVTMQMDYTHNGSRINLLGKDPAKDLIDKYSNELQVKEDTPPTFIIHCADDKVVPIENSFQLLKALKDKDIPVEAHFYPYGGHGFGMGLMVDRLSKWSELFIEWLKSF